MYQTNPDIRFRYIYKKTFRCIYREFNSDGKTQEAREEIKAFKRGKGNVGISAPVTASTTSLTLHHPRMKDTSSFIETTTTSRTRPNRFHICGNKRAIKVPLENIFRSLFIEKVGAQKAGQRVPGKRNVKKTGNITNRINWWIASLRKNGFRIT